jgi:acyl CoA:acetate/3-ketoacid CoA transferase beta subunit
VSVTRADVCAVACAELFRGDGEILASPMGLLPSLGARLARLTFEPNLLVSDGEATLLADDLSTVEGWLPYRKVFDVVAHGSRHVVMGANQLDRHGNQNISCIGEHTRPTRQLLGFRGAPGNTINHRTSYWVPRHSPRVFVDSVDVVSGVGYDRVNGAASRYHDVYRVVTNLAVLGFVDGMMCLVTVHPGVPPAEVAAQTGFPLDTSDVGTTRLPTDQELRLLDTLDHERRRDREVPP